MLRSMTQGLEILKPQLPGNFEQLDAEERKAADGIGDDVTITKSCELRTLHESPEIYHSLNLPSVFRELFPRSGQATQERTIALRACISELFEYWKPLGLTGECPTSFTKDELLRNEQSFKEYRDWHDVQDFARDYPDTGADGRLSQEFDFLEVRQRNKTAFEIYITEMINHVFQDYARTMWPFRKGVEEYLLRL